MSLHLRLIMTIVLLLSALWAPLAVWYFFDVRAELRTVLDARMASSARMVLGLIERGELQLPPPGAPAPAPEPAPLESPGLPTELVCQLWTIEGRLIAAGSGGPTLWAGSIPDGYTNRLVDGEPWRVYALTDQNSGLRVVTAERRDRRMALMRDVAVAVSAPVVLILPATVLLVWLAVRRGLAPLDRLRRMIRSRDADALDAIPEQGVPPEVAPLVQALNDLLSRLADAFERERRFTGNAAHELRTPLAGIKTQLQIAQAADGAVRERALSLAESGLDRMSRLVSQMLTLARLEGQPAAAAEPDECRLGAVVEAVRQELEPLARQREVETVTRGDMIDALIPVPASMLYTALRNLLENALNHSAAGERVLIEFDGSGLRIVDAGPGLSAEQRAQAVRRFHRAGTTTSPGTGLGLSIVAAIAQRYGLQLRLDNREDGPGLIATLHLSRQRAPRHGGAAAASAFQNTC